MVTFHVVQHHFLLTDIIAATFFIAESFMLHFTSDCFFVGLLFFIIIIDLVPHTNAYVYLLP